MTRCTNCQYRWKSKEKHWLYELIEGNRPGKGDDRGTLHKLRS